MRMSKEVFSAAWREGRVVCIVRVDLAGLWALVRCGFVEDKKDKTYAVDDSALEAMERRAS